LLVSKPIENYSISFCDSISRWYSLIVRHVQSEDKNMSNPAVTVKHRLQEILCADSVLIQSSNLKQIFEKLLPLGPANVLLSHPYEDIESKIQKFLDKLFSHHSENAVAKLVNVLRELNFNAVAGK